MFPRSREKNHSGQVATNGDALPWVNRLRYTELMLARSIVAYRENSASPEIVSWIEDIPDCACYARLIGLAVFNDLEAACRIPLQPDRLPGSALAGNIRNRHGTQTNLR